MFAALVLASIQLMGRVRSTWYVNFNRFLIVFFKFILDLCRKFSSYWSQICRQIFWGSWGIFSRDVKSGRQDRNRKREHWTYRTSKAKISLVQVLNIYIQQLLLLLHFFICKHEEIRAKIYLAKQLYLMTPYISQKNTLMYLYLYTQKYVLCNEQYIWAIMPLTISLLQTLFKCQRIKL